MDDMRPVLEIPVDSELEEFDEQCPEEFAEEDSGVLCCVRGKNHPPPHHVLGRLKDENIRLRERSGAVTDDRKLVSFLYELLRDHLPAAKVEALVRASQETPVTFTNGYLAQYAQDVANRLK